MVDDVLFVLGLVSLLMVGVRLDGALRSVFVRRWIYCMLLVSGFRGCIRLLVRVRSIGAAVVAIVGGGEHVVVIGG